MDIDGNGPPTPRANPRLTTAADSCCWTLPPRGRALGSDPSPSSIPLEGKRASLRQRPKPSLIDPRLSICDVRRIAARRQDDRCFAIDTGGMPGGLLPGGPATAGRAPRRRDRRILRGPESGVGPLVAFAHVES